MPSTADAYASACAWLPAEIEITPRAFSSSVSVASLFSTPRGLNEPVRWRSSALKWTRHADALGERARGEHRRAVQATGDPLARPVDVVER